MRALIQASPSEPTLPRQASTNDTSAEYSSDPVPWLLAVGAFAVLVAAANALVSPLRAPLAGLGREFTDLHYLALRSNYTVCISTFACRVRPDTPTPTVAGTCCDAGLGERHPAARHPQDIFPTKHPIVIYLVSYCVAKKPKIHAHTRLSPPCSSRLT